MHRAPLLLLAFVLAGCMPSGSLPDPTAPDGSDEVDHVYDPDRVLRVSITMADADWQALREQTRDGMEMLSGEDCLDEPWGSPFSWFHADVTLDGELFEDVGVRKKGFLGSLSQGKPGLKVDLSEWGGAERFSGTERLTLNNAIQDPSFLRQCLGYGFFADAGGPASRCSYATVMVNGDDLGIYVNVEPIKKQLLGRFFDDVDGALYEGTLSDFRDGWDATFERKDDGPADQRPGLDDLVAALTVDDDALIAELEAVLDLDAFLTHWAAEVLLNHADGYAWNTNNYYLYVDPADGRLHFIPWGIDAILYYSDDDGLPASVYAYGLLANRLFEHPEGRGLYRERMQELLDGPFDEDALLERLERDRALVLPELPDEEADRVDAEIDLVRQRLLDRRPAVEAGLADDETWPMGLRQSFCWLDLGLLEATFSTTWGSDATQDLFEYGDGTAGFDLDGEPFAIDDGGSVAGDYEGEPVLYVAGWISQTEAIVVYVTAPHEVIEPGSFEVGFGESGGGLLYIDTATMDEWQWVAFLLGTVHLEQASLDFGDPIVGSIEGELMSWGG
jgi:spore coat protein CotH